MLILQENICIFQKGLRLIKILKRTLKKNRKPFLKTQIGSPGGGQHMAKYDEDGSRVLLFDCNNADVASDGVIIPEIPELS